MNMIIEGVHLRIVLISLTFREITLWASVFVEIDLRPIGPRRVIRKDVKNYGFALAWLCSKRYGPLCYTRAWVREYFEEINGVNLRPSTEMVSIMSKFSITPIVS